MDKKIKEIVENTVSYITVNRNVPASIKVGQVSYSYTQLNKIFTDVILNTNAKIENKQYLNAPNPNGVGLVTTLTKKEYLDAVKTLNKFIKDKGRSPNYIIIKDKKVHPVVMLDILSRILKFQIENKRLPNSAKLDTNIMKKNYNQSTVKPNAVYNHFIKVFGAITDFDSALKKIKDKGYGHYFNGYLSNKQVIDNLAKSNGKKPNCVDCCQMMWHIAKALGYDVKCIHVLCSSGEGHVFLRLKHSKNTEGAWITRDPACVVSANGKPLTCVWCGAGKIIDTNPSWFMQTLDK